MSNTPTTPASVASRLTDKNIELMAYNAEADGWISTAAVLRDYVRMRNENSQLKKANSVIALDNDRLRGENAQLKARLDAVVKELEYTRKYCAFACVDPEDVDAILRAARGEGGAE